MEQKRKKKVTGNKIKKETVIYGNYNPARKVKQVVLRTKEEIDEYQKKFGWNPLAATAAKKYVDDSPVTVNDAGGWCTIGGNIQLENS